MPNLHYDGTQDFGTLIMNMIEENNKISAKIMAERLGISLRTVRRIIKEMIKLNMKVIDLVVIGKLNSF